MKAGPFEPCVIINRYMYLFASLYATQYNKILAIPFCHNKAQSKVLHDFLIKNSKGLKKKEIRKGLNVGKNHI